MNHASGGQDMGLTWKDGSRLMELDFADDIALLTNFWNDVAYSTKNTQTMGEKVVYKSMQQRRS